ncbi:hypothetical protein FRX31_027459 [Thalictrum thalictroides]|uniref:Uncharacterized protein n=1 Tax=Thalictrum thalictroides TaxID=46969 RepID=A0A7J6VDH5_THATH|nr:hypothetical protein FRX31_027459 [Thalictrum thalictroides]
MDMDQAAAPLSSAGRNVSGFISFQQEQYLDWPHYSKQKTLGLVGLRSRTSAVDELHFELTES